MNDKNGNAPMKNEKTLKEIILQKGEHDYSFITALKEKAESIAKMSTLDLNNEELKKMYNNYLEEARMLKNKIKLESL